MAVAVDWNVDIDGIVAVFLQNEGEVTFARIPENSVRKRTLRTWSQSAVMSNIFLRKSAKHAYSPAQVPYLQYLRKVRFHR